jgi:hypothetical protein
MNIIIDFEAQKLLRKHLFVCLYATLFACKEIPLKICSLNNLKPVVTDGYIYTNIF